MENTIGQQLRRSLTKLVSEVEEHNSLGSLLTSVPRRKSPKAARNETGLSNAKQEPRCDEGAVVILECLEGTDSAKKEELQRQPLARADAVEDHVGWNLEEYYAKRKHLLADVELVLCDADILHEVISKGVSDIASIEFCSAVRRWST